MQQASMQYSSYCNNLTVGPWWDSMHERSYVYILCDAFLHAVFIPHDPREGPHIRWKNFIWGDIVTKLHQWPFRRKK